MRKTLFVFLFALPATGTPSLVAQTTPLSDTLQVNSIKARVQSNGAFFLGGENGHFLVPDAYDSGNYLSLMKAAGLWLGARDSAGNLRLSAQLYNENGKTDFYPGILNDEGTPYPEFNLIAGVTAAEINAHIADPNTMIPAIYGWPASGNSAFANYHGFDLPFDARLAGFYDKYGDGSYSPFFGDYPTLELRGCPLRNFADEQFWFSFHDVGPHTQSGGQPLNMEVQTEFFGFNCQEGSPVDRVLYVKYKLINRNPFPLDSCYFGVFLDFEIGNGDDDFIGCDPTQQVVYAYNGDDTDEGGFEQTPPVMAVSLLRGPLDSETGEPITNWHFVPVEDDHLSSPDAYYRLLQGRHPDGTPFPNNGLMYTGNPLSPGSWSEAGQGNTPGERKALCSFGPFRLWPYAVNELVLGYTWVRKYPNGSVADNLSILKPSIMEVQNLYYNCFDLFQGCPAGVAVQTPEKAVSVEVAPNPFSDQLNIVSKDGVIATARLMDVRGVVLREYRSINAAQTTLNPGALPAGIYLLELKLADGRTGMFKVVK